MDVVVGHITSTWTATIWVGTKVRLTDESLTLSQIRLVCREYCDEVGLCVSMTQTEFIYTDGCEYGAAIGIINYPRFPEDPPELEAKTLELAKRLASELRQLKVTVVLPERIVMLENRREEQKWAEEGDDS